MIEPEDVARMENLVDMFVRRAGDDPAAFAQVCDLLTRFKLSLPTAVTVLRGQGYSSGDLAKALGVTPSAVRERFHWSSH